DLRCGLVMPALRELPRLPVSDSGRGAASSAPTGRSERSGVLRQPRRKSPREITQGRAKGIPCENVGGKSELLLRVRAPQGAEIGDDGLGVRVIHMIDVHGRLNGQAVGPDAAFEDFLALFLGVSLNAG